MYERITQVRRVLYVAECPSCKDRVTRDSRAKERFCPHCKVWVPYVEESYTGPGLEGRPSR